MRLLTLTLAALLALPAPGCRKRSSPKGQPPAEVPRIVDVHTHVSPKAMGRLLRIMDAHGIRHVINLSGGFPGGGLERNLAAAARTGGRVSVMCNIPWRAYGRVRRFVPLVVRLLARCKELGAVGLKIPKGLGLAYRDPEGKLLRVDDARLDPIFAAAGRLGLPVSIHTGDPQAFWRPNTPDNERHAELSVHPAWSFHGQPVPSWEALWRQFANRVRRHRHTRFVGVHFGNAPEDLARVDQLLRTCPNLYIDTAARIPEIGRHPPARLRAFFLRHQDRILFGTDLGVGRRSLMLGSSGAEEPGPADVAHFYRATRRFFETHDRKFAHPTPIQGAWKIDGIGLPPAVLRKIYQDNAKALFKLRLTKRDRLAPSAPGPSPAPRGSMGSSGTKSP